MTGAPPRPVLPTDASPREVVLWTVNVVNTHDAEALRQAYRPDTLYRTPTGTRRGADEVVASWRRLFAAVPDTTLTALDLVAEGGTVFLRWRLSGTHTGDELEGVVAGGARISIDGIDQVGVEDGTIVSTYAVFDRMQLARPLGLLPAEGSRVETGLMYAVNALNRMRRRG